MHATLRRWMLIGLTLAAPAGRGAETWLRWNQAGYSPDRDKELVVMSEADLAGRSWRVVRTGATEPTLEGRVPASVVGRGPHTPLAYNHVLDVSALRQPGDYLLTLGTTEARIRVEPSPYRALIHDALQHLRMVRSGTAEVPEPRRRSHAGDAHALVHVPAGDPAEGRWQPDPAGRTVDASGGWYDAGDQIKFTLNEAYTTYVLLLASNLLAEMGAAGQEELVAALLVEARHGLQYLARTFPDADTFVIQVGDERDHNQPYRLPEDDALDGQRPALCALSRVHMGAATAALALGARTFAARGEIEVADEWGRQARRIHARAQRTDTIRTAFERGHVNDFYHDPTDEDQQALAAAELYALTGEADYLQQAVRLAPPTAAETSWASWHAHANAALAPHDPAALARLGEETAAYAAHAASAGQPWRVPGRLVWGSLHRWIGAANAARQYERLAEPDEQRTALFRGMLDYTFGRNPWGVSFLFSRRLPNSVQHLYSSLYHLLDRFPTGALSEGPGRRSTHEDLRPYFEAARKRWDLASDPSLARFNTEEAVFADDAADFMCQEATIGGQADLILLLVLAETGAR